MPEGLSFNPEANKNEDAHKGDFENIHELQAEIKINSELNENVNSQIEFEAEKKQGFDRLKSMTQAEYSKWTTDMAIRDRFWLTAFITAVISGHEDKIIVDPKHTSIPFNKSLVGEKVLELGSYYGDALDNEEDFDHAANARLTGSYGLSEYTGIDLDEPKELEYEEEYIDNITLKSEFIPMDVSDIDTRFPDRQWNVIFGNAFWGYPTHDLGKEGEIKLLRKLSDHLRPGGVMWFKNNERMLIDQNDIEGLGFEYIERNDLYPGLWALRKPGEGQKG